MTFFKISIQSKERGKCESAKKKNVCICIEMVNLCYTNRKRKKARNYVIWTKFTKQIILKMMKKRNELKFWKTQEICKVLEKLVRRKIEKLNEFKNGLRG
ncbi:hypothetical protein BXO88_01125 [Oribacterium sp. C9]|nr:hypothetical protein BXO88_01125 [Oribacterium sp. C9]